MTYTHITMDELVMIEVYYHQGVPVAKIATYLNRTMFNAVLWITRSGAAWRDLPKERYGSWETVYSRFCLWRDTGLLESLFSALNREADYENLSIDSTAVTAHQQSAGAKKGG